MEDTSKVCCSWCCSYGSRQPVGQQLECDVVGFAGHCGPIGEGVEIGKAPTAAMGRLGTIDLFTD